MELLDRALSWGLPRHVVLADAGYGDNTDFREALAARELTYVVGIHGTQLVWTPDDIVEPPVQRPGRGRPRTRWTYRQKPQSVKDLAASLPSQAWRTLTWRRGSQGPDCGP